MIIALNNKCNFTKDEFLTYQDNLKKIKTFNELILFPSYTYLSLFSLSNIVLGSQNSSAYESGAHTGEISSSQLKSFNVKYSIVGHSERRQEQFETSAIVNTKIKLLLKESITPIMCIGETKEEYNLSKTKEVLKKEIEEGLKDITDADKDKIIIAYEPIWAIGTGLVPTNEEIFQMIDYIKEILPNNKVLYGGSANEKNIDSLKQISNIDGYLLGGISLKTPNLELFLQKLEN